ncbi:MAG: 3-deoxy-manno-octulosonate cytidylyltransferase [Chlamydiae bacterium]|nr:3-deoxy-manno-octulosonate cytidylyltransferase [Chlamydiota bacterium]
MKIVCVIPARLESTRFPRKILALLKGKPLIQWVWESARKVSRFDEVFFAIDSHETAKVVDQFGAPFFMTSTNCQSGTDRLVEVVNKNLIDADIVVNWQADEPFITPEMVNELLQSADKDRDVDVWSLYKKVSSEEERSSPHVVKVVLDAKGYALYFSRSLIPFYRDEDERKIFNKHVGMYAYTKKALKKISILPICELEKAEKLEQLRFLYHGLRIKMHETHQEIFGIDLPEHLVLAEKKLVSEVFV